MHHTQEVIKRTTFLLYNTKDHQFFFVGVGGIGGGGGRGWLSNFATQDKFYTTFFRISWMNSPQLTPLAKKEGIKEILD